MKVTKEHISDMLVAVAILMSIDAKDIKVNPKHRILIKAENITVAGSMLKHWIHIYTKNVKKVWPGPKLKITTDFRGIPGSLSIFIKAKITKLK